MPTLHSLNTALTLGRPLLRLARDLVILGSIADPATITTALTRLRIALTDRT